MWGGRLINSEYIKCFTFFSPIEFAGMALACARIKGRHPYQMIAAKLSEIHADVKIQHKVRATVTNNGSNFVKAFREFSANEEERDDLYDGVRFEDVGAIFEVEEEVEQERNFFSPSTSTLCGTYPQTYCYK